MVVILLLLCAGWVFAQDDLEEQPIERRSGDFWISPGAETAAYNFSGTAFGGGITMGYGSVTAIGLKAVFLVTTDGLNTIELNFLFRLYVLPSMRNSGLFVQFTGGPVFCAPNNDSFTVPAEFGTISAGLCAGWRFPFGEKWFVEPVVRGGYPFVAGGGVSAGYSF